MLWVIGIFTDITISLGLCLRQCSDRYAIRAGRNLPDKEFRYLRTVIVTAAVHQDLDSRLAPLLVIFWHWAGITPYTSAYALAESCVFGKQSPELVRWTHLYKVYKWEPFSRSYGRFFAEFLKHSYPIRLSVLTPDYECSFTVRFFIQYRKLFLESHYRRTQAPIWPKSDDTKPSFSPEDLKPGTQPLRVSDNTIRHNLHTRIKSSGILTWYPSVPPFGYTLGPTHPAMTAMGQETLVIRRWRFSLHLRYSYQHFHFPYLQHLSRDTFIGMGNAPLPRNNYIYYISNFGF